MAQPQAYPPTQMTASPFDQSQVERRGWFAGWFGNGGAADSNVEQQSLKGPVCHSPPYVRRDFIRKVYFILTVQLSMTVGIAAAFRVLCDEAWAVQHLSIYYAALFCTLGFLMGLSCCCQNLARTFPANFVLLFGFTLCQSVVIGFLCLMYTGESILLAFGTTSLVFMLLTAYACLTKTDFTGMGPYLMAGVLTLMSFACVIMIWSMFQPVPYGIRLVYALVGVLLFSFFIVHDTQLIVGGDHKVSFSVDEYVFAALSLYMDIINMFLMMLSLFGDRN